MLSALEAGAFLEQSNFSASLKQATEIVRSNFVYLDISFQSRDVEYRVERASISREGFIGG